MSDVAELTASSLERVAVRRSIQAPGKAKPVRAVDAMMFDADWYLETYPDVAMAGVDPVRHYLMHGVSEKRNPNRSFDTAFYLIQNPDVERAGIHPFMHYIFYGQREGRSPSALYPRPTKALLDRGPK